MFNQNEFINMFKKVMSKKDIDDKELIQLSENLVIEWCDFIGLTLKKGSIVKKGNIKYLVLQDVLVQENQSPDSQGMLAIYKPYQSEGVHNWVYGEYCTVGDLRYYDDILYKSIQNPNANIVSPNQVPAIWQIANM